MIIRRALPGDEDKALPVVLEFYSEYVEKLGIPFFPDGVKALSKTLTGPESLTVVAEHDGLIVGFLAGVMAPWYINPDLNSFEEAAWFVSRGHRRSSVAGRLYREMERLWVDYDVKVVFCGVYEGGSEALNEFYERKGYQEIERKWMKRL